MNTASDTRRKFDQYGQSGAQIGECLPHLASIADDVCLVRSMVTDVFNHGPAKLFINMTLLPSFQETFAKGAWQTPVRLGIPLPDPIVSFEGHNVYIDNEQDLKRTLDFAGSVAKDVFGQ